MKKQSEETIAWKRLKGQGRRDPVVFAEKILGLELHEGQKRYLRESIHKKHYLLCPSNQWGKTVAVAILHIWANYYKFKLPGWQIPTHRGMQKDELEKQLFPIAYQTLNISPRLRQAKMVYRYIIDMLNSRFTWKTKHAGKKWSLNQWKHNKCRIPTFLIKPFKVPHDTSLSSTPIQFNNNSLMYIASTGHDKGSGLAGDQFALITYDECAASDHLDDELGNYIWSRLVKYDGSLHLISTPDSDSESYEYYRNLVDNAEEQQGKGSSDWGFQMGIMRDNTFLTTASVDKQEKEMERLDPVMYRQVFRGEFVGSKSRFFTPMEIERMFSPEVSMLEPQSNHRYVIGADFAVSQNYTVFIVLDITRDDQWFIVRFERFKGERYSPQYQLQLLSDISINYNMAEVVYDASSLAGPFMEYSDALDKLYTYPNKFDAYSKKQLLVALKKVLSYNGIGKIRVAVPNDENELSALKRELHTYREKDRGKVKDCVMALGLTAWRMEELTRGDNFQPFELDALALSL